MKHSIFLSSILFVLSVVAGGSDVVPKISEDPRNHVITKPLVQEEVTPRTQHTINVAVAIVNTLPYEPIQGSGCLPREDVEKKQSVSTKTPPDKPYKETPYQGTGYHYTENNNATTPKTPQTQTPVKIKSFSSMFFDEPDPL